MNNFIEILVDSGIKSSSGKDAKEIFTSLLDEIESEVSILKESNQIRKENNEFYKKRNEVDSLDLDYRKIQISRYETLNAANYKAQKSNILRIVKNIEKDTGEDFSSLKKNLEEDI